MASITKRARRDSVEITHRRRTFAQWFCTIVGAVLVVAGVLGFIVDASFDTGNGIQGDKLLGLEVNGWHNLVHLGSGLVLLAAANTAPTARLIALTFGVTYLLVTLIGLADGEDVLALLPVNGADNVLHLVLAVGGLVAGFLSPTTRRVKTRRPVERDADDAAPAADYDPDAVPSSSEGRTFVRRG